MREQREKLLALARDRIEDAARAFNSGGEAAEEEPTSTADPSGGDQPASNATIEAVERAWREIGREPPARGENYWEAGVSSLDLALFSEELSRRLGFDVEFADLIEYPETDALARFLRTREADDERGERTSR